MPRIIKNLTTKVLGTIEIKNQLHFILQDGSGFEAYMPQSLVQANGLKIERDDYLYLTPGLYEMWFVKEQENKMVENSNVLFRNFHKLYENKELIINKKGFNQLSLKWLYSGGLYYGTLRYSLGSLFKEWETNPKLKKENGYIYKIGGSMLSGANQYESLNIVNGKYEKGSIKRANGEHWTNYLEIYKKLTEEPRNKITDNIIYSNQLISILNLT